MSLYAFRIYSIVCGIPRYFVHPPEVIFSLLTGGGTKFLDCGKSDKFSLVKLLGVGSCTI